MTTDNLIVGDKRIAVSGSWLKTAQLEDEWQVDLEDPVAFVKELSASGLNADIFSFWQRPPNTEARFSYFHEWDQIAVLPVTTYEHWLKKQLNSKTRNMLTKAEKKGVVVRQTSFDDAFIRGMVAVFNETPVRQGKPFWHYGKDFETIKREFSRYLHREELYGAYVEDELVGFIFLIDGGHMAMLGQIISMVRHRDKAPNNALIAKAVEVCGARQIPFLAYANWPAPGSLRDFKKHNGFECVPLPRYYVPLTLKGNLALRLKLHRGASARIPESLSLRLKAWRSQYYAWRHKSTAPAETGGR